jgi:hypothetical protein
MDVRISDPEQLDACTAPRGATARSGGTLTWLSVRLCSRTAQGAARGCSTRGTPRSRGSRSSRSTSTPASRSRRRRCATTPTGSSPRRRRWNSRSRCAAGAWAALRALPGRDGGEAGVAARPGGAQARGLGRLAAVPVARVISGRDFAKERGRRVAELYGSQWLEFPELDHWGLVLAPEPRDVVARFVAVGEAV